MTRVVLLSGLILAVVGTVCSAAPLDLTSALPDIFSAGIDITYNAGADTFSAVGFSLQYNVPPDTTITDGVFDLSATIDEFGVASAGSLAITGTTSGGTGGSGLLLEGSLIDFGFSPDGFAGAPTFEFVYELTAGALAPDFGGVGSSVGVVLSSFDEFAGEFDINYEGTVGVADAYPVPERAAASLTALAFAGALLRARWRRVISR